MNLKRKFFDDLNEKNDLNFKRLCRIMDINDNNRKPRACNKTKKNSTETAERVMENEITDEKEKKKKSTEKKVTRRKTKSNEQSEIDQSSIRKGSRLKKNTGENISTETLLELQVETNAKRQTASKRGRGKKKAEIVQEAEIIRSPEITVESKFEDPIESSCPISNSMEIDEPKYEPFRQPSNGSDDDEDEFSFEDAEKDVEDYLNLIKNSEEEKFAPSPFDQTMYNVYYMPTESGFIEEDRNWDADFDPNFNIEEHLKLKPNKSCLRSKPPKVSNKILTYKYLDENNQEKFIIYGYSHSTFIKRIITYLKSLSTVFEMEMVKLLTPGINLEARLLGNLQMISDVFNNEMMLMVIYSIYNKDSNNYFLTLMEQLEETIMYFVNISFSDMEQYEFPTTREIFPITSDPNINTEYVNSVERALEMYFVENFYLFNALLIYGVFNKHIHFDVLRKMYDVFIDAMHKAAVTVMSVD